LCLKTLIISKRLRLLCNTTKIVKDIFNSQNVRLLKKGIAISSKRCNLQENDKEDNREDTISSKEKDAKNNKEEEHS
jgi:hypothetical protein